MATCTSDVSQEQYKTEKSTMQLPDEIKKLKVAVANLEEDLRQNARNMQEIERKIQMKNSEMQSYVVTYTRKSRSYGILYALVPFVRIILRPIYNPFAAFRTRALNAELSCLDSEKKRLQSREYELQDKLTDRQLKLARYKIKRGKCLVS